jgi:hypothetical protein
VVDRYYNYGEFYYRAPAELSSISQALPLSITKEETLIIPVPPATKVISGISLAIIRNEKPVTKPYELELYDTTCSILKTSKVVDAKRFLNGGTVDLETDSVEINGQVCVKLYPYKLEVPANEALLIARDDAGNLVTGVLAVF